MFAFISAALSALGLSPAKFIGIAIAAIAAILALGAVYYEVKQSGEVAIELADQKRSAEALKAADDAGRAADDAVARTADPNAELRKRGWIIDAPK